MTTDFYIISGTTVPKDYFWDIGNPLETTPTLVVADSTTEYISGYAPGLKVVFKSDIKDLVYAGLPNVSSTYTWNFGDYYNSINNTVVLNCVDSTVEHTYMLPGKYNVSLTNIQSKENVPDLPANDQACAGRYRIGWYWDNLSCTNLYATTWDETNCVPPATAVNKRTKRWDDEGQCFQRYCKNWTWKDLNCTGRNPVFWYETYEYGDYYKRWEYEANNIACNPKDIFKITVDVTEQVALKPFIVEVLEKPPVAIIYSKTYPLTGYSPYTFKLSPIHTKTGSFPIDRIDWNPGDGSSIKTVTRYSEPDGNFFIYNNTYFSDPQDPRNYDFVYTINRNTDTYPIFYPSLTCYSASTNTTDSCSIVVGPILLEPQNNDIHLLKVKNTLKGDFYGIEIDKNVTVLTTTENKSFTPPVPNNPSCPVKFLTKNAPVVYFGNTGENYPPEYIPGCEYVPSEPNLIYLITEEQNTTNYVQQQNLFNWGQASNTLSAGSGIAGLPSYIIGDLSTIAYGQVAYSFPTPLLSATTYCFSCYVKKNLNFNNADPLLRVNFTPGGVAPQNFAGVWFNQATGVVAQTYASTTSSVLVQDYDTYYRVSFTFNTQSSAVPASINLIPTHGTSGSATLTGTTIEVAAIQVELGDTPTPYIPGALTLEDTTLLYK